MRYFVWTISILLLAAVVLATPLPNYYLGILVYGVVLGLLGTSVNLTLGYIGNISFGHAAYFGLGAYTAGLLSTLVGVSFWSAVAIAVFPGVLLGALVGFASIRVGGAYFAIATLTVAEFLRLVTLNWIDLTRGPLGILVPRPRIGFLDGMGLDFQRYYLLICIACLLLSLFIIRRLLNSPYGRAWAAIKEAPELAESVGIRTLKYRVANTALSGGLASLAGALLVPKILVLTPDLFGSMTSATGLLVAILGGKATLIGPILGGLVFAGLPEALRFVDQYRIAIFAALLLISIRVQPGGIMAMIPRRTRKKVKLPTAAIELMPVSERVHTDVAMTVEGIGRSFGGLRAVDNISFEVVKGNLVGLIGPNGAGKTTCLTLLSGFVSVDTGKVVLNEQPISGRPAHWVAAQGVVRTFQQALVCGQLTAFENVLIGTHLHGTESIVSCVIQGAAFRNRERARIQLATQSLALVGLLHRADTIAADMPYGEQKMLSIAIALAAQPRLLLLDEPAAGLNHTEAAGLASVLLKLRGAGLTLVVVDHNLRMMMKLCDRMIVMHAGKKLAEGSPEEVRNHPEVIRAYLGERKHQVAGDAYA
ncbi:MAG: branched-chain amino acid ABC transporter ATP-binding protein/permease [Polaromonas sp.]|uniref:branched-chain amino acid ABC transporter ATP-binding protein/permease n=1 Tax=Polaromonas sp. TaxID=1869339 RepID=UPI0025DAE2DA|nr:branched-chain amino acid ABC transporter ATP-binding protein/permease [Polaromonas sp.]MBI2726280.1 branched-chain amino acid ABC transporter ATP-binding protein/permease [Polaromonas sp.]